MTFVRQGEIHVHYGFIHLMPDINVVDVQPPDLHEAIGGQRNGICGAGVPGMLHLVTGLHTGPVDVRLEVTSEAPGAPGGEWEDVVEVSMQIEHGDYMLSAFEDGWFLQIEPGTYRVRYAVRGMDQAEEAYDEDAPRPDAYALTLWPAPAAPEEVVREGSQQARNWAETAAETPPREVWLQRAAEEQAREEERRAAEREAALAAQREREAAKSAPYPPELAALGQVAKQLVDVDREFAEDFARAPLSVQRELAAMALERVVRRRDPRAMGDVDWSTATAAIRDGAPVRAPFDDPRALAATMGLDWATVSGGRSYFSMRPEQPVLRGPDRAAASAQSASFGGWNPFGMTVTSGDGDTRRRLAAYDMVQTCRTGADAGACASMLLLGGMTVSGVVDYWTGLNDRLMELTGRA